MKLIKNYLISWTNSLIGIKIILFALKREQNLGISLLAIDQKKSKLMDQSTESASLKKTIKLHPHAMVCPEQNINLPSNLLQKRKNILQQMRMIKTSQNSRINSAR